MNTHQCVIVGFWLVVLGCGCHEKSQHDSTQTTPIDFSSAIQAAVDNTNSESSKKDVVDAVDPMLQGLVDKADLILAANIRLMAGSRIKAITLENVELLRGELPVGKEIVPTLRYHPLVFSHRKDRFIFFLSKPDRVRNDVEVRLLIGGEIEPAGLLLGTDSNLEQVREAIRLANQRSK